MEQNLREKENHREEKYPAETKTPGRQRSKEKADTILDGAMAEFLDCGYAAASMDRVAAAAGVSKATVYRYFQDKESLFAALVERLVKGKFSAVFNPLTTQLSQAEPGIFLRAIATKMLDNATNNPQLQDFMRALVAESGRSPELAHAYVDNLAKPVLETLSQYFAARPELELSDPEAAARVFVGSLVYFVLLQEVLHGKVQLPMERDRIIECLVNLMTRSIPPSR